MRLIDADALIAQLIKHNATEKMTVAHFANMVIDAPTVDAVPVVRCADCIRYRPDGNVWGRCTMAANPMRKKDFCSYGVRKDGERHESVES